MSIAQTGESAIAFPPPPLPGSPADITAEWLAAALSAGAGRPVYVVEAEHEALLAGAASKLRVRLRYEGDSGGLPERLWIKAGWEEHSAAHRRMRLYEREARFYRDWAPLGSMRVPACFYAAHDDAGDAVLLLEDLGARDATLWTCTEARSVTDIAALLDTLARLHARWWHDPAALDTPLLDVPIRSSGPLSEWPRANGGDRIRSIFSGPRGDGLPAAVRDGARVEAAFWRMVAAMEASPADCVLHGDPHPGNSFQDRDGGVGLFDWQTLARGPWAFDVAYSIVAALDPALRRKSERDLLGHYLDRLREHGVARPPTPGEAWESYRRHTAYGLLIWPTNHVSHQPEDAIRALTLRFGLAAADHDLFGLWGV